jgi:hypothetical protein
VKKAVLLKTKIVIKVDSYKSKRCLLYFSHLKQFVMNVSLSSLASKHKKGMLEQLFTGDHHLVQQSLVQEVRSNWPVSWLLNYSGRQQSCVKATKSSSNSAPLTHQLYKEIANKLSTKAKKTVLFCTTIYIYIITNPDSEKDVPA